MKTKISFLTITLASLGLSNNANTQTVTDIDSNVYNTVTIGTQIWMKENLKVTKYRNGDAIPTTTSTSIPNDSTSKYQWAYNGIDSNIATYGRLYTWYAVTDSRNVCPAGWHVPTDVEWATLTDYLGGASVAGGKMKETGTSHWLSPNTGADNSSGFTSLPGGNRSKNGSFYYLGYYGFWWSTTEDGTTDAWNRNLGYVYADAIRSGATKSVGFSVRCLRDIGASGLNEINNNSQFKFYPNPSNGNLNISIADIITNNITIEIYNVLGVKVLQQKTTTEIDLSHSSKGIYFVKIYDGTKIYNQKIVVQ